MREHFALAGKVTGGCGYLGKGVSFRLEERAALQTEIGYRPTEKSGIVIESGDNTYELLEHFCSRRRVQKIKFSMESRQGKLSQYSATARCSAA